MKMRMSLIIAGFLILGAQGAARERQQSFRGSIAMNSGAGDLTDSDQHTQEVQSRGDQAMGFDHTRTTHHFLLSTSGGIIQVTANDSSDSESRNQIRMHLKHIAKMFSDGDFEIPMLVHAQTPPGTLVLKELRADVFYKYVEMDDGAKVVISSENPAAIKAIHEFLRFQIKDHHTGDSPDVIN